MNRSLITATRSAGVKALQEAPCAPDAGEMATERTGGKVATASTRPQGLASVRATTRQHAESPGWTSAAVVEQNLCDAVFTTWRRQRQPCP